MNQAGSFGELFFLFFLFLLFLDEQCLFPVRWKNPSNQALFEDKFEELANKCVTYLKHVNTNHIMTTLVSGINVPGPLLIFKCKGTLLPLRSSEHKRFCKNSISNLTFFFQVNNEFVIMKNW